MVRLFSRAIEIALDPERRASLRTISAGLFEVCESLRISTKRPVRWQAVAPSVIPFGTQRDKELSLIPKEWLDEMELIALRLVALFTQHIETIREEESDVELFWRQHEETWGTSVIVAIYDLAHEYGFHLLDDPTAVDIIHAREILEAWIQKSVGIQDISYAAPPHRMPESPDSLIAFKVNEPRGIYTVNLADGEIIPDLVSMWVSGIWW